MKIIIFANDTTYTYNLRNELIERMIEDGCEVVIASQPLLLQDKLKQMGVRLIDINTNRHSANPISDILLLKKYLKILKLEKPDIALTYNIKPNVYGGIACRITKTNYIPNITGLGTAVEYPGIMQKITKRLYKVGIAGADCVMFQNDENKQFFIDHHMMPKHSRIRLLPGSGVSLKVHQLIEYPPDGEKINFLFIARVMAEKGIDLFLNAAKRIYKKHNNTMFHICGRCDDAKYKGLLEKLSIEGYITYHGEQEDMVPYFEMAHCIVHPSYYPEGMSNVLLEAAAHGRPIIATDRAGCRETVDDRKSGFIIPIKNEDALVEALEVFLKMSWEDRKNLGLAGREKVEREFDRQYVVNAYMEEIDLISSESEK